MKNIGPKLIYLSYVIFFWGGGGIKYVIILGTVDYQGPLNDLPTITYSRKKIEHIFKHRGISWKTEIYRPKDSRPGPFSISHFKPDKRLC